MCQVLQLPSTLYVSSLYMRDEFSLPFRFGNIFGPCILQDKLVFVDKLPKCRDFCQFPVLISMYLTHAFIQTVVLQEGVHYVIGGNLSLVINTHVYLELLSVIKRTDVYPSKLDMMFPFSFPFGTGPRTNQKFIKNMLSITISLGQFVYPFNIFVIFMSCQHEHRKNGCFDSRFGVTVIILPTFGIEFSPA